MRTIKEIVEVESWAKDGKLHHRTHAIVQKDNDPLDLEEVTGYGLGYDVGEIVEVFFDDAHHQAKMQKK